MTKRKAIKSSFPNVSIGNPVFPKNGLTNWIPAFAGMTVLFFGLIPVSRAEATKEYARDAGFYNAAPFSIGTFAFSIITQDFEFADAAAEGLKVARTDLNLGWGGWFYMNTTANGNFFPQLRNFTDYIGGSLRFWVKSTESLTVEIQHGAPGVVNSVAIPSTGGVWQEQVIPFASFTGGGGINFTQIRVPFLIRRTDASNTTPTTWYVDHVRWTKPLTGMAIFPTQTQVNTGKKRQFTVEGRDAAGELVIIYSTFSAPASLGTLAPAAGARVTASTLTADTTDGNVTTSQAGVSTSAAVDITPANLNQEFGLISETISGAVLGVDSDLSVSFGGGAASPVLTDDFAEFREGAKSLRTNINSPAGGFAGWFVQWGLSGTSVPVRNMHLYYDGSLRFWVKAPAALQTVLEVGLRSGNTDPGTELSKVPLRNYVTFDNQWHPVAIPITHFTGARPWADISRTKVFFSIFAIGNTGGAQTFYIDNLRWDTRIPGALATMSVVPTPVTIPLGAKRQFTARGFDAAGATVDVFPTWSTTGGIGSFSPGQGATTILTAAASPASGNITATQASVSSSAVVNVAGVTYTQSYNVYSDAGSGGFVGVATGGGAGTALTLSEQPGGVASDPATFRRSTYTLVNNAGLQDAFAVWFTEEQSGSRFMRFYQNGYLQFWVRTTKDLQVGIRSANIAPGAELSKFRLSEYGVPLDGNFQKVVISLADFKAREPRLDFDQIKTYFTIGALSTQIGPVTNEVFDVDDVKWLTADPGVPDESKVYTGLKEKQHATTGLVLSFDNDASSRAVTYDQALAAMNYTYRDPVLSKTALSKKVFDVYKAKFDGGGFAGFHDEYKWDNPAAILDFDRLAGPNAWMLLALIHYRAVTGLTTYDAMMGGIASWLLTLQDTDGAVKFGYVGGTLRNNKSTEHNFDCYAAFRAYAQSSGNGTYNAAADRVFFWLQSSTGAWNAAQGRFRVGRNADGSANNDKALDCYSWAPPALSSFTSILPLAEIEFSTAHICNLTGVLVSGYDFSGMPGQQPDRDAVWIEGTAQMAVAYQFVENPTKANALIQEIEKTIITTSLNGQGAAYATNAGTAYGFTMDSLHPAAPSMAWYLFAKKQFNPFRPFPVYSVDVRNISDNVAVSTVTWSVSVPTLWRRANQYIRVEAQPISIDPWGIQIYTDNTNASANPRFVDPTPGNTINLDSDPAGLLMKIPLQSTTTFRLPMAWSIKDSTSTPPAAFDPTLVCPGFTGPPEAFQWLFMKDKATPAIDLTGNGTAGDACDLPVFSPGEDAVIVRKPSGIHTSQGPAGYTASLSPDCIYLEGDFSSAAAQTDYQTTHLIIEFFLQ